MNIKPIMKSRKAQTGGLVSGLIFGIAGLVIGVIIAYVIVSTLTDANLLGTSTAEANSTASLVSNFTAGVDEVATKLPTILLVAAIVLVLGVLALLVGIWQRMKMGGGGAI